MTKTKQLTFTALCVALGLVLPMTFHAVPNGGSIFLPMHIPVLLCGLLCGWQWGALCGVLTPFLSSVLTGMPPAAMLPSMLCELLVYGLVSGLLLKFIHSGRTVADLYLSLIGAMLAGRLVAGILRATIFPIAGYSFQVWITASFITALPGIVIQLVLLPVIVETLRRARIIARA